MSTGAIIGIIIAIIVVAAIVVLGPALLRQVRMRRQFGPEYDRLANDVGSKKAAAELTARQRRVDALGIHPLSAEQQASYSGEWTAVQQRFVEAPAAAVSAAGTLVWDVMRDRGYPTDDKDASIEALSVYHARALGGYRQAQDMRPEAASTEELRTSMLCYRTLFTELVGAPVVSASQMSASHVSAPDVSAPDVSAPAGQATAASRSAVMPSKTAGTPS